jgi:hypothetical protein
VHRPEPGTDRGQGRPGRRAGAVQVSVVAGVPARAPGAHDTQPAARRADHLPAVVTHDDLAAHLTRNPNRIQFLPVNYYPLCIINCKYIQVYTIRDK